MIRSTYAAHVRVDGTDCAGRSARLTVGRRHVQATLDAACNATIQFRVPARHLGRTLHVAVRVSGTTARARF